MKKLLAILLALLMSAGALAAQTPLAQSEFTFTADGTLPSTCAESTLGSLAADASRAACGADLALLPGGLFSGTLASGAVFASDFARVVPEDAPLVTASVTPAQLYALLEQGVACLVIDEGDRIDAAASADFGYPQTSGFTWTCDASAPAGSRVMEIRLDGTALDPSDTQTHYRVAATAQLLGASGDDAGISVREALCAYAASAGTLREPDARASVLGTASYPLIDRFPIAALVCGLVLLLALASIPKMKYDRHFSFRPRLSMFRRRGAMHPDENETGS